MKDESIPSANVFAREIEEMVWMLDVPYIEAVIKWCEERGLEPEIGAGLVKKTPPLKLKIESEGLELNLVRGEKGSTLFD